VTASFAATPPGAQVPAAAPASEACPLCNAPLAPDQEWCLRCGAAARTRLAAAPNWRGPLLALAAVVALALGVLTAALVKLAGDSGPAPAAITRTVTSGQPTTAAPPAAGSTVTPGATGTVPTTPTTPTTAAPQAGGAVAPPASTPSTTATTPAAPGATTSPSAP
jgi:hypothetical protein